MARKYENGKWVEVYDNPTQGSGSKNNSNNRPGAVTPKGSGGSKNNSASSSKPPVLKNNDNYETTKTSNEATAQYIDIEENILEGDLSVIPDPHYKAKATVLLQYLGKFLTGLYFVDKVEQVWDKSDGYSQTMTVSRNGFGNSLKSGSVSKPVGQVSVGKNKNKKSSSRPTSASPTPVKPKVTSRTYTIKKGDSLWAIAVKFYGKGNQYVKIYNANKDKIKNPSLIYPGQKIKIP